MDSSASPRDLLAGIYVRANRLTALLLVVLGAATLGMAAVHGLWWPAIVVGLPASIVPIVMIRCWPTALTTRLCVATAFMVHAGLQIHLLLGMIEGHFVIFVLLSILLAYRDWRVLACGAGVIAGHHLLFCYLQHQGWDIYVMPQSHMMAYLPMVLIHAAYVIVQTVVLGFLARQMARDAISAEELSRLSRHIGRREGIFDLGFDDTTMRSHVGSEFKRTMQVVRATLGRVKTTLVEVAAVSTTINHGNDELADRNRRQETALVRTQGKLEAIGGSVQENSDHAQRASMLASEAGDVADEGQRMVNALTGAMHQLRESSNKITEITDLIDSIAFQTNILALNAAVEAARAGESGRGFAVVAGEVQALANRSAEASRDIRALIGESRQQVVNGTARAEDVARTMTDMLGRTNDVARLIDGISQACCRQSDDIGEVNADLRGIAQDTEENGSLVESVSHASERLHQQSSLLDEAVSSFDLGKTIEVAASAPSNCSLAEAGTRRKQAFPQVTGHTPATAG
ncbi:methyl-accepting chemotaxis protein [Salinicola acroporae]|uniref:Chemotaxis protein n=1 Tax=Salinicola acroporae TaxID=1541440 RepID=A0ABT6I616_9GAMM|nr:methyl-accepting chemotaxis protein [Salinicola acroporae]MDH4572735.1 chemotaxis protein [Salinicola acroporae]